MPNEHYVAKGIQICIAIYYFTQQGGKAKEKL